MTERKLMQAGKSYVDSYEDAIAFVQEQRRKMENIADSHFKIEIPDSPDRDFGVVDPDEK